ncbi:MAG: hypothetical protein BGN96_06575 [Bacteroidales bacterium 45-6]|nr:MAG: hypothetical protein BGN96_06575 [Bacteroidales bacterium 45-6]
MSQPSFLDVSLCSETYLKGKMKRFSNRQIFAMIGLLYFVPTALGILGSVLEWEIAPRLLAFGIYTQGAIVVSFVLYLLILFLKRFW